MFYLVDHERIHFKSEDPIQRGEYVVTDGMCIVESNKVYDNYLEWYTLEGRIVKHDDHTLATIGDRRHEAYTDMLFSKFNDYFTNWIIKFYPLQQQNFDVNDKTYLIEDLDYQGAIKIVNQMINKIDKLDNPTIKFPTNNTSWIKLTKIQYKILWLQKQKDTLLEVKLNINKGTSLEDLAQKLTMLSLPGVLK